MIRLLAWLPRAMPLWHPRLEALLAWCDGEIRAVEAKRIASHLVACTSCRTEAERLYAARRQSASSSVDEGQARLVDQIYWSIQANMHAWRSLQGLPSERRCLSSFSNDSCERDDRHLLSDSAIRLYFGARAATRLARQDEVHLLPASKALFSAFLGRRASEALARQIADTAG